MSKCTKALIVALWVQVPSIHAADWPQFRGPNRDGQSPETGLLKQWPEAGPRLVRTITGVGGGFSSPLIAEVRIYITGVVDDDLKIFSFDLSGKRTGRPGLARVPQAAATCERRVPGQETIMSTEWPVEQPDTYHHSTKIMKCL